jgi:hypothetical protein
MSPTANGRWLIASPSLSCACKSPPLFLDIGSPGNHKTGQDRNLPRRYTSTTAHWNHGPNSRFHDRARLPRFYGSAVRDTPAAPTLADGCPPWIIRNHSSVALSTMNTLGALIDGGSTLTSIYLSYTTKPQPNRALASALVKAINSRPGLQSFMVVHDDYLEPAGVSRVFTALSRSYSLTSPISAGTP